MVSMVQMDVCRALVAQDLRLVDVPAAMESPIPGLILLVNKAHDRLEMVLPDGKVVDLLQVYRIAHDQYFDYDQNKEDQRFEDMEKAVGGREVLP